MRARAFVGVSHLFFQAIGKTNPSILHKLAQGRAGVVEARRGGAKRVREVGRLESGKEVSARILSDVPFPSSF